MRNCLVPRAQLLKMSARLLLLIGDKASLAARDSGEVPRVLSWKRQAQLVFEQQSILVGKIFHPGRSHGCCPVRTTGGSLLCRRYLLGIKRAA